MKLGSGFCLCVLCGSLTLAGQGMPGSSGSWGVASVGTTRHEGFSAALDRISDTDRAEIEKQIDATERVLNAVKRPLNGDEQRTARQVRIYVARAREALKQDDLEGARTLSTKAHVLMLELSKGSRRNTGSTLRPI